MNNGAEEVLGRKHMIAALIKLRKNGEITQSDLNEYITNWKIVKDRFDYEGSELCRCLETECAKLLNESEDTSERRH